MLKNYLTLGDAKIEIRYVEGERRFAAQAFDVLDAALPTITSYFAIAQPFPRVRVILVASRAEFDRLVRDLLRVKIEVPSHPARIAQPQRTDMVALSPSAYHSHSTFEYVPDQFGRLLVHELVHMVEEHLSPDIEASPRWWGEGLAIYLSGQWLHDDEFNKPALDGIAQRKLPGFRQIEVDTRLAYDWGWTIVRFVEHTYSKDMIVRIVRECPDGDVLSLLGEETASLEARWMKWLLDERRPALAPD
jgi:hypothetical protein